MSDKMIALTDADFNGVDIVKPELQDKVVLLDFWAIWCEPCKAMLSRLEKMVADGVFPENVVVAKVNCDDFWGVASDFKVMSIPQMFIVKNGKVTARLQPGMKSVEEILEAVK